MKYIPNALGSGFLLNEILVMFFIPMSKRFSTVTISFKIWVPFSSAIKMASVQDWFYGFYRIFVSSLRNSFLHVDFIIYSAKILDKTKIWFGIINLDLIKISINMKRVKMNLFDKSIFKF